VSDLQDYTEVHHQNPVILGQYVNISHWHVTLDMCSKQAIKSVMIM